MSATTPHAWDRTPAPTPPIPPAPLSRRERMRGPVVGLGSLALLTVALHLRDPHQSGSWGLCPSALLGLSCPGCGGLRAVNDLTHGDLAGAASSNLALVVALPFLVAMLGVWTLDRWRGTRTRLSPSLTRAVSLAAIVAVAAFTLARNLPFGAWLAP